MTIKIWSYLGRQKHKKKVRKGKIIVIIVILLSTVGYVDLVFNSIVKKEFKTGEDFCDIVCDTENVYVVSDCVLFKFTLDGDLVWKKPLFKKLYAEVFESTWSHIEINDHFIYVCSHSSYEICIAKYDSNGEVIWRKNVRFIRPIDVDDICVNRKYIYIIGSTYIWPGEYNLMLIKYDSEGNLIWIRTHPGIKPYCKAYAYNNFVYMVRDGYVAKLNAKGDIIWKKCIFSNSPILDMQIYDNFIYVVLKCPSGLIIAKCDLNMNVLDYKLMEGVTAYRIKIYGNYIYIVRNEGKAIRVSKINLDTGATIWSIVERSYYIFYVEETLRAMKIVVNRVHNRIYIIGYRTGAYSSYLGSFLLVLYDRVYGIEYDLIHGFLLILLIELPIVLIIRIYDELYSQENHPNKQKTTIVIL